MNPILPREHFVPDGEPHVMPDGRLYLYGSLDQRDAKTYCSDRYHVFSTADMENWTDHGVSLHTPGQNLYAPDCAHRDGKYYLYFCTPGDGEFTAVSVSPAGPFTDIRPLPIAHGTGIDPAVLVDDDGEAYYFWGQFALRGAKLNPDMRTLDEGTLRLNILTEERHGFHEGASIRKRNGLYYLVYTDISRGRATCLSYAVSKSPLGPYEKGGTIIDNIYCDPGTWNNHGSMEQFDGQWYIFYHRASRNGMFSRRACAEKIFFDADGAIREVEMTSQGASAPIDAFSPIDASLACRMKGGARIKTAPGGGELLSGCKGSEAWPGWAEYKYVHFGPGASAARITARGRGTLRVCQDGRTPCAEFQINSSRFTTFESPCELPGGIHPARLFFISKGGLEVKSFEFIR